MKKIILSLMALAISILISGCSNVIAKGIEPSGKTYTLWEKDGIYSIAADTRRVHESSEYIDEENKVLKSQLNIAAKETKKMGYNYFVLVNDNVNNLNGFPLNNYKNLSRFITLKKRKPSFATDGQDRGEDNLISTGAMRIRFKPVSATMLNNGLISVWSVSQTLKDTK